jgi:hypothetical protein
MIYTKVSAYLILFLLAKIHGHSFSISHVIPILINLCHAVFMWTVLWTWNLLTLFLFDLAQPLNTKNVYHNFTELLETFENFWGTVFWVMNFCSRLPEFTPFVMLLSCWGLRCITFCTYRCPVFLEVGADGTIRIDELHWEGFPRLALEALSASGYITPPIYEETSLSTWACPVAGWPSSWLFTRTTPTGSTSAPCTGAFVGRRPSSRLPYGCWRTSVTTTRLRWPCHHLGCFQQWTRTT